MLPFFHHTLPCVTPALQLRLTPNRATRQPRGPIWVGRRAPPDAPSVPFGKEGSLRVLRPCPPITPVTRDGRKVALAFLDWHMT